MKRIVDSKQAQTQKLIKRADVPIALVFFHGLHSRVHMLSRPTLPTQAQDRPHVAESHHEVSPCCSCQGQGLGKISWKWRPAKCQSAQKSTSSNIEEKPITIHYHTLASHWHNQHQTTRNGIGGGSSKSLQAMSFSEILMLSLLSMNWNEASTWKSQVMVIFTRILPKNLWHIQALPCLGSLHRPIQRCKSSYPSAIPDQNTHKKGKYLQNLDGAFRKACQGRCASKHIQGLRKSQWKKSERTQKNLVYRTEMHG